MLTPGKPNFHRSLQGQARVHPGSGLAPALARAREARTQSPDEIRQTRRATRFRVSVSNAKILRILSALSLAPVVTCKNVPYSGRQ
jgi:hypothetical protein